MPKKITVPALLDQYRKNELITAVAVYDYTFARLADAAGIDILLVGDSLGTVFQGQPNTLPVSLNDILYHCQTVVRASKHALVIADMPFMSYQLGPKEALESAGRLVKQGSAAGVKLEGGREYAETIRCITRAGIPVMGHIGLKPQSVHQMGGYKVQGKKEEEAESILSDAHALEQAGAFSLVLEGIPADLAGRITAELNIPSIGIGAGVDCSGQILVIHDLLGLTHLEEEKYPRFVRRFANLAQATTDALQLFVQEVQQRKFPAKEHSYSGEKS